MGQIDLTLRSDLFAGSGESSGNVVDNDLCFSAAGLPYLPARRLKGCLRDAALFLQQNGSETATDETIAALFGDAFGRPGALHIQDAVLPGAAAMEHWLRHAATEESQLPKRLRRAALPGNVIQQFATVRGQTRMENGVKVDGSLRFSRVMNQYDPLCPGQAQQLHAEVHLKPDTPALRALLQDCCRATRHIGTHRNRGLGMVTLAYRPDAPAAAAVPLPQATDASGMAEVEYHVALLASVTLPGRSGNETEIPARSVIGCMANAYLQQGHAKDPLFRQLFLDGTTRWSSLTPVLEDVRSDPSPMVFAKLKDEGTYVNLIAAPPAEGKKIKPVGSSYAVWKDTGYRLASVGSHTLYHHQHSHGEQEGTLYMQDSLDAGMVYGGTVTVPAALLPVVQALLQRADLRFGRSKSAQYANCALAGEPTVRPIADETFTPAAGEPVFAILRSDLLLTNGDGLYDCSNTAVRKAIAAAAGLGEEPPTEAQWKAVLPQTRNEREAQPPHDTCAYRTITGYQTMWQLQKPQLSTVRAGSYYCFAATGAPLPRQIQLGELPQEGFGVCMLIGYRELEQRTTVTGVEVQHTVPTQDTEVVNRLQEALIVATACDAMMESARTLYQSHAVPKLQAGLPGRMRLILEHSHTYADLLQQIGQISSSTQPESQKRAQELVACCYHGADKTTLTAADLLGADSELLPLLRQYPGAAEKLLAHWKEPLLWMVHQAYYEKDREERKG